jgi:hypothetical protein
MWDDRQAYICNYYSPVQYKTSGEKRKEFPFFTYFRNQETDGKKYTPHKI